MTVQKLRQIPPFNLSPFLLAPSAPADIPAAPARFARFQNNLKKVSLEDRRRKPREKLPFLPAYMARLAEVFPTPKILHALSAKLSWTHFRQIIYLDLLFYHRGLRRLIAIIQKNHSLPMPLIRANSCNSWLKNSNPFSVRSVLPHRQWRGFDQLQNQGGERLDIAVHCAGHVTLINGRIVWRVQVARQIYSRDRRNDTCSHEGAFPGRLDELREVDFPCHIIAYQGDSPRGWFKTLEHV